MITSAGSCCIGATNVGQHFTHSSWCTPVTSETLLLMQNVLDPCDNVKHSSSGTEHLWVEAKSMQTELFCCH